MSRRRFIKRAGAIAGSAFTSAALSSLALHSAFAQSAVHSSQGSPAPTGRHGPYGPVRAMRDSDGRGVLALPEGFQYVTFSRTGERAEADLIVPPFHDGMACFGASGDTVRLIRNHEVRNAPGDFRHGVRGPEPLRYDRTAGGGCMTLDFDVRAKRLVRQFVSLGGTLVNCAGGFSFANRGWLSCEETTRGVQNGYERPHGYVFHVPAAAETTVQAVPLKAMGRFMHEAAVADSQGIVYETEDAGYTSGFYRFVADRPDDLQGGRLQMLALRQQPHADLYAGQTVGRRLPVRWIDIPDADPVLEAGAPSCFAQGREQGGAAFNRLEGLWRGEDGRSMFFASTSGGGSGMGSDSGSKGGFGQIWRYLPADPPGQREHELVLIYEAVSGAVLESPDNICITPRGAMLICEDDAIADGDTHPLAPHLSNPNRLIGLDQRGVPFTFAVNMWSRTEFAGACFSPDGDVLFVNLQGSNVPGSGMTCAIWGPWERGPL